MADELINKYDIAFLNALGLNYNREKNCIYTMNGNHELPYTPSRHEDGWTSRDQSLPRVMKRYTPLTETIVRTNGAYYTLQCYGSNLSISVQNARAEEQCRINLAPGQTPESFIIVDVTKNEPLGTPKTVDSISCPQDTIFNFIDLTSRKEQIPETDDETLNKLRNAFEQEIQPEFREFFKSAVSVYSEFFEDVQRNRILYYISNDTAALAGKASERRLKALKNIDYLFIDIAPYKKDNKYKTVIHITMDGRNFVFSQELPNSISPDSVNAIIHWVLTDHDVMKSFLLTSTGIEIEFSLDMQLSPDCGMPCHYIRVSVDCYGVPKEERAAIIEEYKSSILREFPKEIGGTEYGAEMRGEVAAQKKDNLLANSAALSGFFQNLDLPSLKAIIRSMPNELFLRCIDEINSHSVDQAVDQGNAPIVRPNGHTSQG